MTASLHDRIASKQVLFRSSSHLLVEKGSPIMRTTEDRLWLKHAEYSNLRLMYHVHLLPVYDHERHLNAGRFLNFHSERLSWVVSMRRTNTDEPWSVKCAQMVNWIADHVESPWSLDVEMESVFDGIFNFSFEDDNTATFFKLTFV